MSKDPAFLMYSKDWLTGTQFMSMEERGMYITLILAQHQNGHLDPKRVGFLLGLTWDMVSGIVKSKFKTDSVGFIFNERLEEEMEKRAAYMAKQIENGRKGGRPKKPKDNPDHNPNPNPEETTRVADANKDVIEVKDRKEGVEEREGIVYPYNSETFKVNWLAWRTLLRDKHEKDYFNLTAEQSALMGLNKLAKTETEAIEILQQSLRNGWKDLFKLKTENGKQTTDYGKLKADSVERMAAIVRSKHGNGNQQPVEGDSGA